MYTARKALVTAICISALLMASTPSLANFFGPGFGLNGLASGWGPLTTAAAAPLGSTGTLCGSGVLGAPIPPVGCGTIPSCARAGPSYAGSPGVYCSGFPPFTAGVPVPVPVPQIVPAAVAVPAPVPAAVPVAAPVCAPVAACGSCIPK
jgi:hypothetical protein